MIDNKTDFLQLALPNKDNELNQDIFRIIASFNSLDQFLKDKFSSAQPIDDWNKASELGYYFGNNALNAPETDVHFLGLTITNNDSSIQLVFSNEKIFWRTCLKDKFLDWVQLPSSISSSLESDSDYIAASTASLKRLAQVITELTENVNEKFVNIFATQSEVITGLVDNKAISPYTLNILHCKLVIATLTTTWTSNLQTITVEGLPAEANFLFDIADNATQAQREAWAELQVFKNAQAEGSVEFLSYDPNTIEIPIKFLFGGLL